jgi:SAM-dependent methyltransferase
MKNNSERTYIERVSSFTDKLVNLYNRDYKAGDHGTPEDQSRRYQALSGIADLNYASILDVGCGVGLLYDYLVEALDSFQYIGVDVSPRAIRVAMEYQPTIDFRQDNILNVSLEEPVDFVIVDGLLRQRFGDDDLTALRNQILIHCFGLCSKGISMNFLSTQAPSKDETNLTYWEPGEVLSACLKITTNVILRHDYASDEFVVYLYK